ncbi:hypothetical protein CSW50_10040 [Thermus scotoductus]|uniref:Phage tail tape measure protein n=1 Tax=Thermus scotoductus TaxID=37636 RepID=A0A430R0J6_THESC|nr:hypothetical protein [Thermus scotoductus]RTH00921.1 hypothetical protein CSW50_10040 [Thermus scotoductus]
MNNLVEVILRLRDEASRALEAFSRNTEEARSKTLSLSASLGQVQRGLEGLGSSLGAILGSAGLGAFLKSAVDTAFEAESQMRVLARTAQAAGQDFNVLRRTLDEVLQPLGVLPEQAASATAQLLRAGLSTEQIAAAFQAGAASALAAGRSAQQGIENVAMALSTGQSIYLNYIGIAENIGPVMQKVASSMRGASEEAVRQAQMQAALNVIFKATEQEVAALPDLLGGYAGAQNRLNQTLYEFRRAIGEAVMPYLTALINLANDVVSAFNRLDAETKRQVGTWAALSGGTLAAATALGALLPVLRNTWTILTGLGNTLLWLVRSPIGLTLTAVAALVSAWASAGGDLEESRKRVGLLVQALQALYYGAKGTAEAVVGLFRNIGQTLVGVWAAISKALTGDFAGAWQEVQRVLNLERWAANLTQANQDLAQAGKLLAATWRGEVTPEAQAAQERIRGLAQRVQEAVQGAQSAPPPLNNMAQGLAEVGQAAGEAAKKVKELDDATKNLLERAGMLTRSERERRAPRDWSGIMTGPEMRGVQGWTDAVMDALRLRALDRLHELQSALQLRLDAGNLSESAARELQRLVELTGQAIAEIEEEIRREVEAESEALLERARADSEERVRIAQETAQAIAASERLAAEATLAQLRLVAQAQEELSGDLGAMAADAARWIEESLNRLSILFKRGLIDEDAFRSELAALLSIVEGFLEEAATELPAGALASLHALSEKLKGLVEDVQSATQAVLGLTSTQMRIISEALEEAERAGQIDVGAGLRELLTGPLAAIQAALQTGTLAPADALEALAQAAQDAKAVLYELYQAGEITAEEFLRGVQSLSAYEDAIGALRLQILQTIGPLHNLVEDVEESQPAQDWYNIPAIVAGYQEELERIAAIPDPAQRLEALAELGAQFGLILPALQEWLQTLEESGVVTEELRELLDDLIGQMQTLAETSRQARLDVEARRWADGLREAVNAVSTLHSGLMAVFDAFSAQTFGQGLALFARGIGQLANLIPGGRLIGGLIEAVGGLIGAIWDGIASVFDSGWGKVQERLTKAASQFKLISSQAFQGAVEQYQERYLFGLIRVWKYRVNEAMLETLQAVAGALEGGVLQGVKSAAIAFMRGVMDWANALREGIREAIANAVVEAVVRGAVVKGALGRLLDELTAAIGAGEYGAARAIAERIMATVPALESALQSVLAPFQGFLAGGGAGAGGGVSAIRYELPTVQMAAPNWVSEMGEHVARFGLYVDDLVSRGIRIEVAGVSAYEVRGAAL